MNNGNGISTKNNIIPLQKALFITCAKINRNRPRHTLHNTGCMVEGAWKTL